MNKKLKLYVWTDFCPDWTSGLAVAVASSEKEARNLVSIAYGLGPEYPRQESWGTLTVHRLSKRQAFYVCGGG